MKKKIIYSLFLATLVLSACSTALDVNGNYKETMVIYGLLDQSQPKQYIKVNKAFLGQGNAYAYAQIKDSSQYANALTVKITTLPSGPVYTLLPDKSIPKQPGTFYAPDQANAIYSNIDASGNIVPMNLSTSNTYQLTVQNGETGTTATATTSLIDTSIYTAPSSVGQYFIFIISGNGNSGYTFYINWNSGANARLYQTIVRFNYIDSTISGSASGNDTNHIDMVEPILSTQTLAGGESFSVSFKGEQYLEFIGNQLSGKPVPLARRALKTDIILVAGSDDLNTYIQAAAPSTGILQDKPIFTNIANGYGLFSSRYNKPPFSKPLSAITIDSLACGQYTKTLHFLNAAGQLLICH